VPWREPVFWARQLKVRQDTAHRGKTNATLRRLLAPLAECPQGGVWSRSHEGLYHLATAGIHCGRLAPTMGLRRDTARVTLVCEQPASKAHPDMNGDGQLPHRPFVVFISLDNP
jgi:hypothetical protein